MAAYYNEHDKNAAAWLRQLIKDGYIADGDVDERSIEDVAPSELAGYTQCHFFAGIGGWSYALRQAGWADNLPVWTGSCPCQPFSAAGKGNGFADERHLWPALFHLIEQCRPERIFGEQVASPDGLAWLDLVQTDLEGAGYAAAPFDLSAAGFGAPHARQRLYFVAESTTPDPSNWVGIESGSQRAVRNMENSSWKNVEWIKTCDGREFCVEPGLSLLAHGVPDRVVFLRGFGNAIVTAVAQEFIAAYGQVRNIL